MVEYKFIALGMLDVNFKAATLKKYAGQGWIVHTINEDFTAALLEREKDEQPAAPADSSPEVGVHPISEDIRITDSFPVVGFGFVVGDGGSYLVPVESS